MADLIREAPVGQLIRFLTRRKCLQYPEEKPDFELPPSYFDPAKSPTRTSENGATKEAPPHETDEQNDENRIDQAGNQTSDTDDVEDQTRTKLNSQPSIPDLRSRPSLPQLSAQRSIPHLRDRPSVPQLNAQPSIPTLNERPSTINFNQTTSTLDLHGVPRTPNPNEKASVPNLREKVSRRHLLKKERSRQFESLDTDDGTVLVDWYSPDDPANPQNWSTAKKGLVTFLIVIYYTASYMGSSIYSPSEQGVMEAFGVSIDAAELGLALFVLGYAFGPMVFSPLSEWPVIGRNPPYMITLSLYVILCVPAALVNSFAALLVLRFLQGLFASPSLATGPASITDIYPPLKAPFYLSLWATAGSCGPALGPLIAGFSVTAENWRWSLWEQLWVTGPILLALLLLLPETYSPNVLLHRAKRIRRVTGQAHFVSQSELDQRGMSLRQTANDVLVKPFQLNIYDPSIAFTTVYTALIYGIFYSFFECFPFVYGDMYHWNAGEQGLAFLSMTVGVGVALVIYWIYLWKVANPEIVRVGGLPPPERRIVPALYASVLLPVGLFIFAWTANPDVHWAGTLIGIAIYAGGFFIVLQSLFTYLPMSYPQYVASLFAGNAFGRSALAAGTVEFARPMFKKLGVGAGVSLLAGLCCGCVLGTFALWWFGARLRARSRFTQMTGR